MGGGGGGGGGVATTSSMNLKNRSKLRKVRFFSEIVYVFLHQGRFLFWSSKYTCQDNLMGGNPGSSLKNQAETQHQGRFPSSFK